MKTEEILIKLMQDLVVDTEQQRLVDFKDKKAYSKAMRKVSTNKKKLDFTRFCLRYVETKPTEDFLNKERERLKNRINMFIKTYEPLDPERFKKAQISAHKKEFEKEMGIPKIRKQLTTIYFILN